MKRMSICLDSLFLLWPENLLLLKAFPFVLTPLPLNRKYRELYGILYLTIGMSILAILGFLLDRFRKLKLHLRDHWMESQNRSKNWICNMLTNPEQMNSQELELVQEESIVMLLLRKTDGKLKFPINIEECSSNVKWYFFFI